MKPVSKTHTTLCFLAFLLAAVPSQQEITIIDGKSEGNEYWKNEYNSLYPRVFDAGVKVDFGYRFNPADILIMNAAYSFKRKTNHPEDHQNRTLPQNFCPGINV